MLSDLRLAFRQLAKSPGFTATVVLTLALSIGACTVIYSVVDSLLLNPLDNPEPERLVTLTSKRSNTESLPVSPADYLDWKNESRSFASVSARTSGILTLTGEGEPRRMRTMRVTANYFDVLGLKPLIGRTFLREETEPGGNPRVVLLSYALWQDTFGGEADVIGRTIRLNETSFTIIGVMPENMNRAGGLIGWSDIATPLGFSEQWLANRAARSFGLTVQARLKPGVTVAQAQAELDLISGQLAQRYPDSNKGVGASVTATGELMTRPIRTALWALLGAVAGVLLIACANVANLLLVRATARQREISLRIAFGAARSRLVRLLLTESLVLSLLGGGAGALLASAGIDVLRNLSFHSSVGLQQLALVKLDPGMLGFALALSVATGLLFGLAPAWLASSSNPNDALKQGARGSTEGGSRGRLRSALIVFEVAASLMLLASSGLLVRSFDRLANFDPGFDPRPIAYANVTLQGSNYFGNNTFDEPKVVAFADAVLARYRELPGVESAGLAVNLPAITVGDAGTNLTFNIAGRPEVPVSERSVIDWNSASPGFFTTLGIPLLRGRTFTDHDNAQTQRVAVISETAARIYFPGEDPIGQRIGVDLGARSGWSEIVGIVADTMMSYGREPIPQVYESFAQVPSTYMHFAIRTSGNPAVIAPMLKSQIHAVDPNLAVAWSQPMTQTIGSVSTLARQRFIIQLLGTFSGIALVIAVAGIYGVIAYSVSQRTAEIGIRMALGAQVSDVLRLVLGQGVRLVGMGLLIGLIGMLAAGRAIESMLYNTSAFDPLILAGVTVLFAAIALLACWLPARRATKVDPIVALRSE
jgi:putative ABC transport system permease protein